MLWPGPEKSCLYLDPAAGLDSTNKWIDSSPLRLNITAAAGYVTPNWGLAIGPSGAPYIAFNGVNNRGTMAAAPMARFYAALAGQTSFTCAVVARHNAPAFGDMIFAAQNPGQTLGIAVWNAAAERLSAYALDAGGAVASRSLEANDAPLLSRTRVTVLASSGAAAWRWVDGQGRAATAGGNGNPIAVDAAAIPTIGSFVGGGNYFDGSLYFLGLWVGLVFTDSEAKAFSAYWLDRC